MFSKIKYTFGNHTDIGKVRKVNQDSFGSAQNDWGEIFIVADGMGGHKGGEVASKMAVDHICDSFKGAPKEIAPAVFLNDTILDANDAVITKAQQNPDWEGMGTTVVVVIIKDNVAHIAHVGDSRLYIFRHNEPFFITKDHSVVQDLVDKGLISESEAETHPNKNRILQAIGTGEIVPTITRQILYKGDHILLCSDGLSGEVNDAELYRELKLFSPMEACKNLVALANERGGPDNITVMAVHVGKGPNPPKKPSLVLTKQITKDLMGPNTNRVLAVGLILGILLSFIGYQSYQYFKRPKKNISVVPGPNPVSVVPDPNAVIDDTVNAPDSSIIDQSAIEQSSSIPPPNSDSTARNNDETTDDIN